MYEVNDHVGYINTSGCIEQNQIQRGSWVRKDGVWFDEIDPWWVKRGYVG